MDKITGSRGPRFDFQHLCGSSQRPVAPVPGDSIPSGFCVHRHIYTHKIKKKQEGAMTLEEGDHLASSDCMPL